MMVFRLEELALRVKLPVLSMGVASPKGDTIRRVRKTKLKRFIEPTYPPCSIAPAWDKCIPMQLGLESDYTVTGEFEPYPSAESLYWVFLVLTFIIVHILAWCDKIGYGDEFQNPCQ
jgi:hypothetical protein